MTSFIIEYLPRDGDNYGDPEYYIATTYKIGIFGNKQTVVTDPCMDAAHIFPSSEDAAETLAYMKTHLDGDTRLVVAPKQETCNDGKQEWFGY